MAKKIQSSAIMDELLEAAGDIILPSPGVLVDGAVVAVWKNKVLVDLGGIATGIIAGQEAHDSSGTLKDIQVGDMVTSYILEEENDDGLVGSINNTSYQYFGRYTLTYIFTDFLNNYPTVFKIK